MFNIESYLLRQPLSGKRQTPIWLVIPLTFLIIIMSQIGAIFPALFTLFRNTNLAQIQADAAAGNLEQVITQIEPKTAFDYMLFLVGAFLGIYLLVGLWVRLFEGRPFWSLGLNTQQPLFKFARGFLLGAIMFVVVVVPGLWAGLFTLNVGPILASGTLFGVSIMLVGWLVQGPAEELLFRGWVLPVVAAKYRLWLGILLSSVMFAIVHGLNPGVTWLAMLNLLLFGVFTALYALYEETIWGVCGLHAVWNWVQGNIFGLEVSGSRLGQASLFVVSESGPDWVTGGSFGPEGGLLVTGLLLVAVLVIVVLFYQKQGNIADF